MKCVALEKRQDNHTRFVGLLLSLLVLSNGCSMGANEQSASGTGSGGTGQTQVTQNNFRLPPNFIDKTGTNVGTGRVFFVERSPTVDVSSLLQGTVDELSVYFDGTPQVIAGFVDQAANMAQATFVASVGNQPIKGIAIAQLQPQSGHVWIIFDRADTFSKSFAGLIQNVAAPASTEELPISPQSLEWQEFPFPDGSGSIALPEGWQIIGLGQGISKGSVDVRGWNGATVVLGGAFPVSTPGSTIPDPRVLVAPYATPEKAVFLLDAEVQRTRGQPPNPTLKILETKPLPAPAGQHAALLHLTLDLQGQPYESLAYVLTTPTSPTTWLYYQSQVYAPQPVFRKNLPVMLTIWKSWKVSSRVYQERLDETLTNLQQAAETGRAMDAQATQVRENASWNWTEYIRNETLIRDTQMNEVQSASLEYIQQRVNTLNQEAGYTRYVEMPLREYYR